MFSLLYSFVKWFSTGSMVNNHIFPTSYLKSVAAGFERCSVPESINTAENAISEFKAVEKLLFNNSAVKSK